MVPPGTEEEIMNKLILSSIAAVAFALSASAAFADAADRDFPDNPILAEQYFHDHQAPARQTAATEQAGPAKIAHHAKTGGQPYFASMHRSY
jgi:hypothetical protein